MDKLIGSVVKTLQQLVHDKSFAKLAALYQWERAQPSGLCPARYLCHTKHLLKRSPTELFRECVTELVQSRPPL